MIDKKKSYSTTEEAETAVLVAVSTQKQTASQTKEYLEELEFLVDTAGGETVRSFMQKM